MSQIKFSEHPEYEANATAWTTYRDLYEGDHAVLSSSVRYLWPHELESKKEGGAELRAIRELRSRYLNIIESIVSRYISFFFRKEIVVPEEVKKLFGEEYKDVTGDGVSFQSFFRDHFGFHYVLFGKACVLVDSSPIEANTKTEAKALGKRPFFELVHPLELKDWQLSTAPKVRGSYDFMRIEYELVEPRTSPEEEIKAAKYCKVLSSIPGSYTITTYKAKKNGDTLEWEKVDEKPVGLAEVPVVCVTLESFIKDASEQQLMLFNLMSAESCILNAQAFQKIFVIGVNSKDAKLAFGEYVANFLPEGASVECIEPADTTAIASAINATIDRMFKVAFNQVHTLSADSKEAPGMESQREAKDDFYALIKSNIEQIETCINQSIKLWAKFKGLDNFTGEVELDKSFSRADIQTELEIFNSHKDDLKRITTAYREILKRRVADLNLPKEKEIFQEIDTTDFTTALEGSQLNGTTKQRLLEQVNGTAEPTPTA